MFLFCLRIMWRRFSLVAVLFALSSTSVFLLYFVRAACGPGWEQRDQKCYKIFTSAMDFFIAHNICAAVGGQIVSIPSAEVNNLVARIMDEDYMLCNGIDVPSNVTALMDAIAKRPLFCTPKTQWLFLSFFTGLHRKRDGRGGYISTWEDGSLATFGNVPEHRGIGSKDDYPWSGQEPSGTVNWNYHVGPAEECAQMWHPCGWWNDIKCDRDILAGVVCQKNAT